MKTANENYQKVLDKLNKQNITKEGWATSPVACPFSKNRRRFYYKIKETELFSTNVSENQLLTKGEGNTYYVRRFPGEK